MRLRRAVLRREVPARGRGARCCERDPRTRPVWGKSPVWDVTNRPRTINFNGELGFCEPRAEWCGKRRVRSMHVTVGRQYFRR